MLGVDDGLRGIAREDRQRRFVVRPEPIAAFGRHDDDPVGAILEAHRHDEHGLGDRRGVDAMAAWIRVGVGRQDRLIVLGDPAGQPLADRHPLEQVERLLASPPNVPLKAIGSHVPLAVSTL